MMGHTKASNHSTDDANFKNEPRARQNQVTMLMAVARDAESAGILIDDDQGVTDTFARMLRLEGYTVYTAISPESGLILAAEKRPQAIILDLRMPILSGLRFLELLRARPELRDTRVAIVTGDYFVDDRITEQLETLGASVRFKPLWLDDLVTIVRGLTGS